MYLTYFDGIQHHSFLQACFLSNLLLHTGIHFFPKTRNTAHQCRTDFFNGSLDIHRTEVDTNLHAFMNTKICPCFLEDMCQGKEVHGDILITHVYQTDIMDTESLHIVRVMQHYPLRFTSSTGCIKNVRKVIIRCTRSAFFHYIVVRQTFSCFQELIEIDGSHVTRVAYNSPVEDDQLLQRLTKAKDTESRIILELLAYEDITYLSIIDNVLCLCR